MADETHCVYLRNGAKLITRSEGRTDSPLNKNIPGL